MKGTVLLAEDDADQREILGELLEHEGYRVIPARNADEVLQMLRERPDLVLLDLVGVTNPDVIAAMKAPDRPGLILVSADHRLPQTAGKLGADAFVSKPYDLVELLETIAATLQARAIARESLVSTHQ